MLCYPRCQDTILFPFVASLFISLYLISHATKERHIYIYKVWSTTTSIGNVGLGDCQNVQSSSVWIGQRHTRGVLHQKMSLVKRFNLIHC